MAGEGRRPVFAPPAPLAALLSTGEGGGVGGGEEELEVGGDGVAAARHVNERTPFGMEMAMTVGLLVLGLPLPGVG